MAKILVFYGTTEGQTAKISGVLADVLRSRGHKVDLADARSDGALDPTTYDAVLVGASVHASGYQGALKRWVHSHAKNLSDKPSGFFSVCLGILEQDHPETQGAVRKIATDFFAESHWRPDHWTIFAGAVAYTRYGWLKKQVMKYMVRKGGGSEFDTTRDYEYTNWDDVRRFGASFAAALEEPAARKPGA
jgi:menaquinone-dependent protoporphyrinogen oxidase